MDVVVERCAGFDVHKDSVVVCVRTPDGAGGRASVPSETLLKSTVLMAMYSIRSERAFCERLDYDLLFKWFLDMRIDQPAFDATTFTKNRERLLEHEVADEFFAAVVRQAKLRRYTSSDHFSVDGTLLQALLCRATCLTGMSRDIPDSQARTRDLREPPRGRPEGWYRRVGSSWTARTRRWSMNTAAWLSS